MLERNFQAALIKKIKKDFPGSMVFKMDPNYIQGTPDLIVLYKKTWAALEVKKSKHAKHQPNQDYYIRKMNRMSYASFVYPENKAEVLHELHKAFRA